MRSHFAFRYAPGTYTDASNCAAPSDDHLHARQRCLFISTAQWSPLSRSISRADECAALWLLPVVVTGGPRITLTREESRGGCW